MIYPYRCPACGATKDIWQRLSDYTLAPNIPEHCGVLSQRMFTVPMVAPDYEPFKSHIDGSIITSRSKQRDHMARHGVVLYDDFASELPAKRAAVVASQVADIKDDINEAITKVSHGYVPEQEMVSKDDSGIDVLQTHALPKELKSEVTIEV